VSALAKQTFGYMAAMIFIRLQAFLLLPFVARYVSTEDLSIFDPLVGYATVLGMFSILGLDGALATLYQHPDHKERRRALAGTAILLVAAASVLAGAGLLACTGYIERTVFRSRWDLTVEMSLAAAGILMASLQHISANILRQEFQVRKFNISVIGGGLLSFAATIAVVIWMRCGVRGMLVVTLITGALKAALMLWWVRPYVEFRISRTAVKPLLLFGLPLLPLSVCSWLMSGLDRSLLQMWHTPQEVVDYGMASRFAMLAVVVTSAFQTAWWPYAMSKAREPGISAHFQQVCRVACIGGALLAAAVAAVTPALMWLVLPEQYQQSFRTTGLQVLGNVIHTYYYFPLVSLLVMLKIKLEVLGHLAGMAITVALDFLLVKPLGTSGAALATVLGFLVMAAVVGRLARRQFDFGFPLLRNELFFLGTAGALSVWLWLPATGPAGVLLNTAIALAGIGVAGWLTRLLRREDAALLPVLSAKVKARFRRRPAASLS